MSPIRATPLDASGRLRPRSPWVLVFGGVTIEGSRRAEKACRHAMTDGFDVVLFAGTPVEVDSGWHSDSDAICSIVDYSREERSTLAAVLINMATRVDSSGTFFEKILRRMGNIRRGRSNWLLLRRAVNELRLSGAPTQILYCDESAFVSAWHTACIWSGIEVGGWYLPR